MHIIMVMYIKLKKIDGVALEDIKAEMPKNTNVVMVFMKLLCGEITDVKLELGKVSKLMPGVKPLVN